MAGATEACASADAPRREAPARCRLPSVSLGEQPPRPGPGSPPQPHASPPFSTQRGVRGCPAAPPARSAPQHPNLPENIWVFRGAAGADAELAGQKNLGKLFRSGSDRHSCSLALLPSNSACDKNLFFFFINNKETECRSPCHRAKPPAYWVGVVPFVFYLRTFMSESR